MGEPKDGVDLVAIAVRAITAASDLETVVRRVAVVLADRYSLARAAVASLTDHGTVRIEATWSAFDTLFVAGAEIAIDLTAATTKIAGLVLSGQAVTFDPRHAEMGLLANALLSEGDASMAVIPLSGPDRVIGVLTLGSIRDQAFADEDLDLLLAIAAGTRAHIISLIEGTSTPDTA